MGRDFRHLHRSKTDRRLVVGAVPRTASAPAPPPGATPGVAHDESADRESCTTGSRFRAGAFDGAVA
ncbi:hypothetical protein GCM10018793_57080 [Streptomyces sulfonofaciens]|uniref:Uncharacterized protein n=1 Tax=Streptomyces sulfonofaciens TaxID=68272 RepID=A0A919L6W5_9ACTN|nr:hypothetical protein GCM10018793_57080 [Streptomyces sulfonofaciens]